MILKLLKLEFIPCLLAQSSKGAELHGNEQNSVQPIHLRALIHTSLLLYLLATKLELSASLNQEIKNCLPVSKQEQH